VTWLNFPKPLAQTADPARIKSGARERELKPIGAWLVTPTELDRAAPHPPTPCRLVPRTPSAYFCLGFFFCADDERRDLGRCHMKATKSSPSRPSSSISSDVEMSDDDDIQSRLTKGGPSHFDMDDAFCARMRMAIVAGLECPPSGVITTPGTKNPRYVSTEQRPLASSLGGMDF
jgi:hypothetical protein